VWERAVPGTPPSDVGRTASSLLEVVVHDGVAGSLSLDLLTGQSLRQARRFVRLQAEQCGFEERGDDAVLVVAELLEGPGDEWVPTAVGVAESAGGLLVSVDLGGPQPLRLRDHSEALLTAVSTSWGWRPAPRGVSAWSLLGADPART